MVDLYLGQIIQGGWNFAPRTTATCSAQLLSIQQNAALFALLGTSFGGNGTTNFQLPDLRGRAMIGTGQGPGLSNYVIGEQSGTENVTLLSSNLPIHTHTATFANNGSSLNASTTKASLQVPAAGTVLGHSVDTSNPPKGALPAIYCPSGTATSAALAGLNVAGTVTVNTAGQSIPLSILSPFNTVTIVICTSGIFPSRN